MAERGAAASTSADQRSSAYTVLARRYRPTAFDECIGQEHVAEALKNAINANRVAHAYLFTGARGVGKTSMARILAKALNCERGPTVEPCGECDACQSIATGEDVDVIEIDGASNNGVDQVRELRQAVNFRPSRGKHKIYIIDEVHMLSTSAFNALLKTLEEPPSHVKFIFATTEVQKIPITVLSRCQRFDFAGIESSRIFAHLKSIVASEGLRADDEALELIARRAGGSMRDSQSLLDQLLAFGGETLTADDVHRVLGTAGDERVFELAEAIHAGAADRCLALIAESAAAGVQLGEWIEQTLDYFRDLMVLAIDDKAELVSMSNRHRQRMLEMARSQPPERTLERMDLLAECRARMKHSTYGRTLLEMTLVRLCRMERFISLAGAMAAGPAAAGPVNAAIAASRPQASADRGILPTVSARAEETAAAADVAAKLNGSTSLNGSAAASAEGVETMELAAETAGTIASRAAEALSDVVLAGMLARAARVEFVPPNGLNLVFPGELFVIKEHCEKSSHLPAFEANCSRIAGKPVAVKFSLTAPSAVETAGLASRRQGTAKLRDIAERHPLVIEAERLFGAKIIAVDPLPAKEAVSATPVEAVAEAPAAEETEDL